ncbi:hypothetical protein BJ875DRAFT_438755 [Amylocarpus encephaloides]|uniref:BZIP domain-containing protein n=1 Tax=Amylocarpus encephaloides TaxID=45428 RepID=A0A9P8C7R8_9HELO|nr:hypothetical protein BJ875DRAFT_438755 [Amylocarpus encephaloides]
MIDEPRKKGARGGKRSVTHLSDDQLTRKRANDREAQRNIRRRTRERLEYLETNVQEGSSTIEMLFKRNKELQAEVKFLRAQVEKSQPHSAPIASGSIAPELSEGLLMPGKVSLEWMSESHTDVWPTSHGLPLSTHDIPVSDGMFASNPAQGYPPSMQPMGYEQKPMVYDQKPTVYEEENGPEASQKMLTPTTITPVWADPMVFGPTSQAVSQPTPAWSPFHPAFDQPSRFADLQPSGFTDLLNQPPFGNSSCWQAQPSVYAWQFSTKLKAPITLVDQLMFSVIHSQRHLSLHSDTSGEDLLGPFFPPVHLIFNQPGPATTKPPSNLTEVMNRYSEVLSRRGFDLIPEKLASFMCMYRFVQWQISPTYQTYQKLHAWQAPHASQLKIPHPAWMDLPPWGKFRQMVIENQDRYDIPEFQNDYASNLSVNFPHDPILALVFDDGQIKVSPLMETHLSDVGNMSMKKPFVDKYPEFREFCRFEEID